MAYNNSPWAISPWQYPYQPQQAAAQQPINGLSFIKKPSDLDTLQMPPGSTSQPFFLEDADEFIVVRFDSVGGSTRERFSFEKKEDEPGQGEFVTKDYFDKKIENIMEAINAKQPAQEEPKQSKK